MTLVQKGADALTVLRSHESRRKFTGEKISPECMEAIHDAIMQTSSTCFFQFVTVITVQDQAKLKRIAELAGNQTHIANCSHYLVFCLDLTKLMHFTDLKPPFGLKFLIGGLNDCSMYEIIRDKYNIIFSSSRKILELKFANYEWAKYLGVPDNFPLLSINSVVSTTEGKKAQRSQQLIVGTKFKLLI